MTHNPFSELRINLQLVCSLISQTIMQAVYSGLKRELGKIINNPRNKVKTPQLSPEEHVKEYLAWYFVLHPDSCEVYYNPRQFKSVPEIESVIVEWS